MDNNKQDRFLNLKYMGFCMSQLPPDEAGTSFEDFVRYAKFQLSMDKHVLMEDPIWDKYTEEQILVEYYANVFSKSKDERERFEVQLTGQDPDIHAWFDKMIEQNQKEMAEQLGSQEESINYKPDTLGE